MISVKIENASEWDGILTQLRDHGAALVKCAPAADLQPLTLIDVHFAHRAKVFAQASGQVIQLMAEQVAVGFTGVAKEKLLATTFPEVADTSRAEQRPDSSDKPLWARVGEMTKAEKIHLARHGNADARRLLLKDRDQTLQLHLLNNPGLTAREVASLVRSGAVSHDFLRRVIQRSDLVGNHSVVEAIVRNPHTPVHTAVQLVPKLQKEVLRRIAKSGNLRQAIVSAARKLVLRR